VRARNVLAWFAVGIAVALAAISLWTLFNGTSVTGVYDAMFPFRVEAGRLLASPANLGSRARLSALLLSWLICGGAVAMAAIVWALWRRRLGGTLVWALVVVLAFDVVSVLAGGSYWSHYLIQTVAPVSVLVGVAAARGAFSARAVVVASVVVTAVAWSVALPWQSESLDQRVGSAVGAVSSPDDTIVTVAPTWFLTWAHLSSWGVDSSDASRVLAARYHPVAHLDGHTVYLHNGVRRRAPTLLGPVPRTPPLITTALKELLP
jgi:hypothetical protein